MVCGLLFLSLLLNTITQPVDFKGRVVLFNPLKKSFASRSKLSEDRVNADVRTDGRQTAFVVTSPVAHPGIPNPSLFQIPA